MGACVTCVKDLYYYVLLKRSQGEDHFTPEQSVAIQEMISRRTLDSCPPHDLMADWTEKGPSNIMGRIDANILGPIFDDEKVSDDPLDSCPPHERPDSENYEMVLN